MVAHEIIHLSNPIECTTLSVNSSGNYGLWVMIICWCRSIDCDKCTSLVGDVDIGEATWGPGTESIWELPTFSSYLCLNALSNWTCPKLKVSFKTPPLTSLAPYTFLIFINGLIIYLSFKVNFLLLLLYALNPSVVIPYWIHSCISLSNQPSYFHFPGIVLKGFFTPAPLSSNLPSTLPLERPSKKQSHYTPPASSPPGTVHCSWIRSWGRTMNPIISLF